MLFLHNGKDNHVPFDRYFRIGKYDNVPVPVESVLDLFALTAPSILIKTNRGIDLAERGHEVAKLIFKGYGKRIYQEGLDPQDVLQEVYKGILIRNNGKGAFDPERSSFSHYV
jgi:predicted HAD superfamily Cof-like phosphohydrolase